MITGRRRHYFGYPKNLSAYIDTPDSARSYASQNRILPLTERPQACIPEIRRKIRPEPKLPRRYADRHLQQAIATQIPSLLPPLKNTYRFKEFEDNPISIHNPQLEHQFERSLYYIWLAKNDRQELCRIVDAHLGSHKKIHRHSGFRGPHADEYREIGNPIQRPLGQVDYSKMPRTVSILDTGVMNTKFQKNIADPPKTPRARFVRDHGKSPAMDAICNAYPENQNSKVTERDIEDCVIAAKRLLGPYAGLDTSFLRSDQVPSNFSLLIEENNRNAKADADSKKMDGITRRPFGYNTRKAMYDKQIAVATDFYNRLKAGERNLVPPPELFKHIGKTRTQTFLQDVKNNLKETGASAAGSSKAIGKGESNRAVTTTEKGFTDKLIDDSREKSAGQQTGRDTAAKEHKKHFDPSNVTEQDYMDFYLQYLDENENFNIPKPQKSLTDVRKFRRQLNLDRSFDTKTDIEIRELMKSDSFHELKDPKARRFIRGEIDLPRNKKDEEVIDPNDMQLIEDVLQAHYNKIKDPKIRELYRFFASTPSAILRRALPELRQPQVESEEISELKEKLEEELGFVDILSEDMQEFQEILKRRSLQKSKTHIEDDSDTDADSSISSHSHRTKIISPEECNPRDIECLERTHRFGTPPFTTTILNDHHLLDKDHSRVRMPDINTENIATNIFSLEYWKTK